MGFISDFKEFYNDSIKKSAYILPVAFFTMAAFLGTLGDNKVHVDDMSFDRYFEKGGGLFLSSRWVLYFAVRLLGFKTFSPRIAKFLCICGLILSSIFVRFLLVKIFGKTARNPIVCACFTSIFVTFPLHTELYSYFGANYVMSWGFALAALAAAIIYCEKTPLSFLFAAILLTFPAAGYESSVFAYITLVFAILFSMILEGGCIGNSLKKL